MLYVDTSLLAAYYCPEPLSERAEKIITAQVQPAISSLSEVEFFSAVSRKVREGNLKRADAEKIVAAFLAHLEGHFYHRISLDPFHYLLARDYLGRFDLPLRSLDALHLAVAVSERASLATTDKSLSRSAKKIGIKTTFLAS